MCHSRFQVLWKNVMCSSIVTSTLLALRCQKSWQRKAYNRFRIKINGPSLDMRISSISIWRFVKWSLEENDHTVTLRPQQSTRIVREVESSYRTGQIKQWLVFEGQRSGGFNSIWRSPMSNRRFITAPFPILITDDDRYNRAPYRLN